MLISEERTISLPHMRDTICIITDIDDKGHRVRLNNTEADPDAKIIRIFPVRTDRKMC